MYTNLSDTLNELEEEYGGDIIFIPKASKETISDAENELGIKLPQILNFLYTKGANGLIIDNKIIYGVFDKKSKKSFSDNLQRANNPKTSYWFKHKPEIFKDYLIIGADSQICFAIYKHRKIDNPSIYICENPNAKGEVVLEKIDMDLCGLIVTMVDNAF